MNYNIKSHHAFLQVCSFNIIILFRLVLVKDFGRIDQI
nr:MAG: hypothetical protein H1BulkLitter52208_000001 [Mitovirus sp.]